VGLVKEVLLGLILGWTASLFFASVQMVGEWLDLHGGFQAAQLLNPAFETEGALVGNFKYLVAGLVFLGVGGHLIVLRAAVASLTISPPGVLRMSDPAPAALALVTKVVLVAVQLAAPVAATLFLVEIAMGLIHRALPQVNTLILTFPVKAWVALCALMLSLPVIVRALERVFGDLGAVLTDVLRAVGG
jgi:flagellar biosynthetic protein FliR